jgi:Ribbon-helix-helix protein, copG family
MNSETITIRLSPEEVARVDELRAPNISRSAFVRELLRRAGPLDEEPTHGEALVLLARSARAGKVQAQVALERALRDSESEDDAGWFDRLLDGAK